jgi:hypothetical protein
MARYCSVVLLIILLTSAAYAQILPDAPAAVAPPTNLDRVLMPVAVASIGADAFATYLDWTPRRGISTSEVNPIARTFVSHGTGPLVAYFGVGAGAFLYAHHKLAHHHRKLALVLDLGVIASESYYSQYSFRHHIE